MDNLILCTIRGSHSRKAKSFQRGIDPLATIAGLICHYPVWTNLISPATFLNCSTQDTVYMYMYTYMHVHVHVNCMK